VLVAMSMAREKYKLPLLVGQPDADSRARGTFGHSVAQWHAHNTGPRDWPNVAVKSTVEEALATGKVRYFLLSETEEPEEWDCWVRLVFWPEDGCWLMYPDHVYGHARHN
jgi:hypothetical protein